MIELPFETRSSRQLGTVLKPIIPVRLVGPKRDVRVSMLLDSGADLSLMPFSVGAVIGLVPDLEKRSEVQGVGQGSVPYILSQIDLDLEDHQISARVGWRTLQKPCPVDIQSRDYTIKQP